MPNRIRACIARHTTVLVASLVACGPGERPHAVSIPFDSLFVSEQVIRLESKSGVIGTVAAILRWSNHWVVVDRIESNVKIFDDSGNEIRTIGRLGDGPGEFRRPTAGTVLPSGQLAVLDHGRSQLSFYSWPGMRDTTWTLDGIVATSILPAGDSILVAYARRGVITNTVADSHSLHLFNKNGEHVGSSWIPDYGPGPYGSVFRSTQVSTAGRRIVAGIMASNRIDWFDPTTNTSDSVRVGGPIYEEPAWDPNPNRFDIGAVSEWAPKQMWLSGLVGLNDSLMIARFTRYRDENGVERSRYVVFDIQRGDLAYSDWTERQIVGADRGRALTVDILEDGGAVLGVWRVNQTFLTGN